MMAKRGKVRRNVVVCGVTIAGVAGAIAAGGAGCSGSTTNLGGLMLVVKTDGTLSQAASLRVTVSSQDGKVYENLTPSIPGDVTLPATLGIESNGDPSASVVINASIYDAAGNILDDRINQVIEIPTDRVAELDIDFSSVCTMRAELVDGGAMSTCPSGETCDPTSGGCAANTLNATSLATFSGDAGTNSLVPSTSDASLRHADGSSATGVDTLSDGHAAGRDAVSFSTDDATSTSDGSSTVDAAFDPCSGTTLCDTFDYDASALTNGGTLGPWTIAKTGTAAITMELVDAAAEAGTHGLHVVVPADASANGTLQQTNPRGFVPNNDLYGRLVIFYSGTGGSGAPDNSQGEHSVYLNMSGDLVAADGGDGGSVSLQLGNENEVPAITYRDSGSTETSPRDLTGAPPLSTGTWHCIQWHFDGSRSPAQNLLQVWTDGTPTFDTSVTGENLPFPQPWNLIQIGFEDFRPGANQVDFYLDDFALGSSMIPCPPTN